MESPRLSQIRDVLSNTNWNCLSASLVGSIVRRHNSTLQDIDLYIVLEEPCRQLYQETIECARQVVRKFGQRGIKLMLETRRGPFKEYVGKKFSGQIHLIIGTLTTMMRMPPVTLINWKNNSIHITGRTIESLIKDLSIGEQDRNRDCSAWVGLLQEGLSSGRVPYKLWVGKKKMYLQRRWAKITDSFDMFVFLRHCISTALTHYAILSKPSFIAGQKGLDDAARSLGMYWYKNWRDTWQILGGAKGQANIRRFESNKDKVCRNVYDFLNMVKSLLDQQ